MRACYPSRIRLRRRDCRCTPTLDQLVLIGPLKNYEQPDSGNTKNKFRLSGRWSPRGPRQAGAGPKRRQVAQERTASLARLPARPGCPAAPQRAICIEPEPATDGCDRWVRLLGGALLGGVRWSSGPLLPSAAEADLARSVPPSGAALLPAVTKLCCGQTSAHRQKEAHQQKQAHAGHLPSRLRGGGYRASGRTPQTQPCAGPPPYPASQTFPGGNQQ